MVRIHTNPLCLVPMPSNQKNVSIYLSHTPSQTREEDVKFGVVGPETSSQLAQTLETVPVRAKHHRRSHRNRGNRQGHSLVETVHLECTDRAGRRHRPRSGRPLRGQGEQGEQGDGDMLLTPSFVPVAMMHCHIPVNCF